MSEDGVVPTENNEKKKSEVEKQLIKVDPKLFEGINKEKKERILNGVVLSMQTLHIGPLPDPETYSQYAQLIPNGADRIMVMAEKQLDHRIKLESKALSGQLLQSNIGQFLAFFIGLAALGSGAYCISQGHDWAGGILGVGGLTGLVTAFINGKRRQKTSLAEKRPIR